KGRLLGRAHRRLVVALADVLAERGFAIEDGEDERWIDARRVRRFLRELVGVLERELSAAEQLENAVADLRRRRLRLREERLIFRLLPFRCGEQLILLILRACHLRRLYLLILLCRRRIRLGRLERRLLVLQLSLQVGDLLDSGPSIILQ